MKTKADSPCLHTLIANCSLIMTDTVRPTRWLFPTEALLSQGFPVLPQCRDAGDVFLGFSWRVQVGRQFVAQQLLLRCEIQIKRIRFP